MNFVIKHKTSIIIALLLAILITVIIPFIIINQIYKLNFELRVDYTINLYDEVVKENPNFKREPISFTSNKNQTLRGHLYYYDKSRCKALIVMAHGYGRDSDSYVQEAEYFARNGYLVMSYDNTGTVNSDGQTLVGVSQSPIDMNYALKYVEGSSELKNYPLLLYGHSWGGFAATAVNNYPHNVKAVASISGLENIKSLAKRRGITYVGKFINVLLPYCQAYETFKFGKAAFNTGSTGLNKTDAKVLIIHSTDDTVVPYDDSYSVYLKNFELNPRFKFLLVSGYGHNPALSLDPNNNLGKVRRLELGHMKIIVDFYDSTLQN